MINPIAIYLEHCDPGWLMEKAPAPNHIYLMLTGGSITYEVDNIEYRLTKGDALFVPQGAVRSAWNESRLPHQMYVVHFHYLGDGDRLSLLAAPRPIQIKSLPFDYMKQRFSLLTQRWLRKSFYSEAAIHGILLEMLAIANEEADLRDNPGKSNRIVMELQQYILEHYRRTITVPELAEHVDRTPNYVSHIFKVDTGLSISEYVQQIRISAACDLLTNSQMSVSEISDFLGFCEPSYFNRVFKKTTSLSPSAYIKEKLKVWERGQ